MNAGAIDFAHQINRSFDDLVDCDRQAGRDQALQSAEARAYAAIAFVEQVSGRQAALSLIGGLLDA